MSHPPFVTGQELINHKIMEIFYKINLSKKYLCHRIYLILKLYRN